ncbi:hypothetical protein J4227_04400 [Candidatus Woesearchaeota archaeon]|nr:hypothetical protein [Candidatus Woesearchaeota archaeon]
MAINLESINKLPPQERVKVLQELQARLKKAQEETKKDIEDVAEALEEAKKAAQVLEKIETPKVVQSVEEIVKKDDKISTLEQVAQVPTPDQIHQRLHEKPAEEIYKRLSAIFYETEIQKQEKTQYQENFIEAAQKELYERKKEMYEQQEDFRSKEFLSDSEKLVKYLRK